MLDKIKERILTEENLRELVRLVNEEMDASAGKYRERLDTIVEELTETKRRLDRLYDALETGKLSLDDLAPRIQALRQRQNQLQAARCEVEELLTDRRVQLADMEMVTCYVDDLRGLLSQGSLSEQKAFIRSFVQEVKVTGKEVLITYTIPLPPDGATHERSGVLSIVYYGGAGGIRTRYLLTASQALSQLSYSPRAPKILAQAVANCKGKSELDFSYWVC